LLTGITGFVGSRTAIQLLEKSYQILALRDMKRVDSIKTIIAQNTSQIDNLCFAEADIQEKCSRVHSTIHMHHRQSGMVS
jgi:dihydroflavonol-4-reductase